MNVYAVISEMADLQDRFNSTVSANWREQDYPWHRAAWIECAELIEGTNRWKWWKAHGAASLEQTRLEVVDILHFLLSWAIDRDHLSGNGKTNVDALANSLMTDGTQQEGTIVWDEVIRCAEQVARDCSDKSFNSALSSYRELVASVGLDLPALRQLYISKNALNVFRSRNGYKDGSYQKTWNGLEDNQHLEGLMVSMPDLGFDQILELMQRIYPKGAH